MSNRPIESKELNKDIGFLKEIVHQVQLVWYLMRDSDVPIYLKLLPFISILYILWPVDLVPDLIPVLGQLDDVSVLLLGVRLFVTLSPEEIVDYYLQKLKGNLMSVEPPALQDGIITIDEAELD